LLDRKPAALFAVCLVLFCAACKAPTDGADADSVPPRMVEPEVALKYLKERTLAAYTEPEAVLPKGYTFGPVEDGELGDGDKKHGALFSVLWRMDGPEGRDTVIFTIFASPAAARDAWDGGKPHYSPIFHVERVTPLEDLKYPARLLTGSVEIVGDKAGFSGPQPGREIFS
jgi:hypothetical protein